MKKIIVASTSKNPVKLNAAMEAFKQMFPEEEFIGDVVPVPSGVSDQPKDDSETLQGAINRATNAKNAVPEADYWVGMEGGLEEKNGKMEAFAWIVILSVNQTGKSRTSTFELPEKVSELIRGGMELAHADDQVFKRENSKHKNGAVGILTNDVIGRTEYYTQAAILALIPFKNPDLY
jgi:inosine/xanthosine triphosphatase